MITTTPWVALIACHKLSIPSVVRRSTKWYKKQFFMVVDFIANSSFVVFSSRNPCSRRAYFSALVHKLLACGVSLRRLPRPFDRNTPLRLLSQNSHFWNCMSLKRTALCFTDVLFALQKNSQGHKVYVPIMRRCPPFAQHPASSTFSRNLLQLCFYSTHFCYSRICKLSDNLFLVKRCGLYILFSRTTRTNITYILLVKVCKLFDKFR